MSNKTTVKDEGLEYIQSLGFKQMKSVNNLVPYLEKRAGVETAKELLHFFDIMGDPDKPDDTYYQFYQTKNKDLATSLAVSEAWDSDYIRKACNWISKHREYIGNEVLEVGCDCGIISCFLGKTFPEKHITAIDMSENAIRNAKELAGRFGLTNVTFIHTNFFDIDEDYDTVISTRVLQENLTGYLVDPIDLYLDRVKTSMGHSIDYFAHLLTYVKDGGTIMSILKGERSPLMLATWFLCAAEHYDVVEDTYEELDTKEFEFTKKHQGICFRYNDNIDAGMLLARFQKLCQGHLDTSAPMYTGEDALIYASSQCGDLVEGYFIYDPNGERYGKVALYENRGDETALCELNINTTDGNIVWINYDVSQREEWHENRMNDIQAGYLNRDSLRAYGGRHIIVKKIDIDPETHREIPGEDISDQFDPEFAYREERRERRERASDNDTEAASKLDRDTVENIRKYFTNH